MSDLRQASQGQWLAMDNELRTAFGLLKHGLASLQAIGSANDFYHLPLLLLASGLERIFKCALCFSHLEKTGGFPSRNDLSGYGHNLSKLLDGVLGCYSQDYLRLPVAKADHRFLLQDRLLRDVLACLGDFGQTGRYSDLNTVSGSAGPGTTPDERWQELEMQIAREYPGLARLGGPRVRWTISTSRSTSPSWSSSNDALEPFAGCSPLALWEPRPKASSATSRTSCI